MRLREIKYERTLPYRLSHDYGVYVGILPGAPIAVGYVALTADGWLCIDQGYEWDGPSGPAWDTEDFMRGSLVHDALYSLMRAGALDQRQRKAADKALYQICREDGMSWVRAQYVYRAVRWFGAPYAESEPPMED